jgi:hypothetical protein
MWDDRATRRPRLLLRLSGALSLRYDARALSWSLFQDPPRTTRRAVAGSPTSRNWQAALWHTCRQMAKKIARGALRAPYGR